MMTRAEDYLAERQREHPPWHGIDRGQQLYKLLAPDLLPPIPALKDSGRLAVGEVGVAKPGAWTETEDLVEGHFAIVIYSGLMEFFYTVSRTLCGVERDIRPDGVVKPSLSYDEVVQRVAGIFQDWKAGRFRSVDCFRHPIFPLNMGQMRTAEDLATKAELFVLAHELGNVVADTDPDLAGMPPDMYGTQESFPDAFAVMTMLRSGPRLGWRMTYAGALFALRIFAGLERMGYKSPGQSHPPPSARLEIVRIGGRRWVGDEVSFTAISTIAMAFDELMEGVENVSAGAGSGNGPEA